MTSDNGASRTNPGSEESTIASVTNAALEALRSEVERLRAEQKRFDRALIDATDNAAQKMEAATHDADRHDREMMLRTLNLVKLAWDGVKAS